MPSTPAMTTCGGGEAEGWARAAGAARAPTAPAPLCPSPRPPPRTGTIDFMTSSGRMTPMDAMPTPDLAVPYAAPKPGERG